MGIGFPLWGYWALESRILRRHVGSECYLRYLLQLHLPPWVTIRLILLPGHSRRCPPSLLLPSREFKVPPLHSWNLAASPPLILPDPLLASLGSLPIYFRDNKSSDLTNLALVLKLHILFTATGVGTAWFQSTFLASFYATATDSLAFFLLLFPTPRPQLMFHCCREWALSLLYAVNTCVQSTSLTSQHRWVFR